MWEKYHLNTGDLLKRLERPRGVVDVVIDTDTYNEIDDQFALAYLLKSDEKLRLQAIYAAPFFNHHSESPEDGMEKSFEEIHKVLGLLRKEEYKKVVFKGSRMYLQNKKEAVESSAARNLVNLALERDDSDPLYVIAIGAITNIASAILMEPSIIRKIVVIWLGGNALDWHDNKEFNARQDVAAARVIFECGVPLVLLPCMGVVSSFTTTGPELNFWLKGKNELCNYLVENTVQEAFLVGQGKCWSRAIWDVTAVAWLIDESFMEERIEHSPIPEYDHKWGIDKTRHFIKYVYAIHRDALYMDLFEKLSK